MRSPDAGCEVVGALASAPRRNSGVDRTTVSLVNTPVTNRGYIITSINRSGRRAVLKQRRRPYTRKLPVLHAVEDVGAVAGDAGGEVVGVIPTALGDQVYIVNLIANRSMLAQKNRLKGAGLADNLPRTTHAVYCANLRGVSPIWYHGV